MEFYNTNQLPANLASRSYAASLLRLDPNGAAPILAMSGLAKPKKATGIGHSYFTKTAEFTSVVLTAAITSTGQTTVTASASDVAKLTPNSLLRYQKPTDNTIVEHMLVTSINSATTFSVVRGFGATTPIASLPTSTLLLEIGSAFEQGSLPPTPRSIGMTIHTNFTQIIRTAYGNARTLTASMVDVGDGNLAENKRDCMWYHGIDIERNILFGTKSPSNIGDQAPVYNSRPITTMDGIENSIRTYAPTNLHDCGATTTFDQLEAMLDPLLDYQTNLGASNHRIMYCGKQALKVLNDIGKTDASYTNTVEQTVFGQRFKRMVTTRGTFDFVEHPMLNSNPVWAKMAFVMDFSAFDLRWLRATTTEEIKGSGRDEDAGVMTSELTLEFQNPFSCGVLYGLTAAA